MSLQPTDDGQTRHMVPHAQNKASVAYYLMFDNQMRMKSGAYLREELSEASDAMMQHPSGEHAADMPNVFHQLFTGRLSSLGGI